MNDSPLAVRKLIVGIIALGCLATAAGLWIFADDPIRNPVVSVTMRLGIMLGALWLALPRQGESLAWEKCLPAVVAVITVLAFVRGSWRVLIYAIPAAIVVGIAAVFLRPRPKRRPPR
ncbi:MAG TPA: hypothetical protein VGH74_09895 [Planctomycetaceae bacterium]|jgi:hypothetical protein